MTVYLYVFLLEGLPKFWLIGSSEKNEKMGLGPTKIPLNLESDSDQSLDTEKIYQRSRFSYLRVTEP